MVMDQEPEPKKQKIFSIREFRENLHGGYKISFLQHFLKLCTEKQHDYILEYLEDGGSCMELLSITQHDPNVPAILILEIVYHVLLEIIAKYPQHHNSGYKACNFLLNHHVMMLNKMLGLTSRISERRIALKLLTAIISFSATLAKTVLLYVNFNPKNLKLLTKHSEEKDGTRAAFVNLLCAFLVDGNHPTISALLAKPWLLSSITNGLVYDAADNVCVILTAMQNRILENSSVSKTTKMKVFTTHAIRDIVNLYNWKGPKGLGKKETNLSSRKDQLEKIKVTDCVHRFLVILCTTKHGVIFRDSQVSIGKSQNNLMLTVIQSLERPWEHSYASELVIKTCAACPDITRTVWSNLAVSLAPREANNWRKTINFAKNLILELTPDRIEYGVGNLSAMQLAQVTQALVAPSVAVKAIKSESFEELSFELKSDVCKVLLVMLCGLEKYSDAMKELLDDKNYLVYKNCINEHILKNFLAVNQILDFENVSNEDVKLVVDYLNLIIDILNIYNKLCPQLIDNLKQINIKSLLNFLSSALNNDDVMVGNSYNIQVKIIDLFLKTEPSNFYPNTQLFSETLYLLLEAYHFLKDTKTYQTIYNFLLNTTVFEGCEYEINVWVNAVFNSKKCGEDLKSFIAQIIQLASKNSIEYTLRLTNIKKELQQEVFDLKKFLENLDEEKSYKNTFKHNNLSYLIFALIDTLENVEVTKNINNYVNYVIVNLLHQQDKPEILLTILKSTGNLNISQAVTQYVFNFENNTAGNVLNIHKNNLSYISAFSKAFLDVNEELNEDFFQNYFEMMKDKPDVLRTDIFNMMIFNIINLAANDILTSDHIENILKYMNCLKNKEKYTLVLLKNPNILEYFSLLKITKEAQSENSVKYNLITMLIIELTKAKNINFDYLVDCYRSKIFSDAIKIIKKSKYKSLNYVSILNVIEIFQLSQEQCFHLINELIHVDTNHFVLDSNKLSIIYYITSYALNRLVLESKDYRNIEKYLLNENAITCLVNTLNFLISNFHFDTTLLQTPFMNYLKQFPHLFRNMDELFLTLLLKTEFSKENSSLLCLLLEKNVELINVVIENIERVGFTKGIIIPVLDICVKKKISHNLIKVIYDKFETNLLKGLEKPQKAGQYFEKFHVSIGEVMKLFLTGEKCKVFVQKVNKFEISDPFLGYLLKVIYVVWIQSSDGTDNKYINNAILSYVNIMMNIFKNNFFDKLDDNVKYFNEFLNVCFENVKNVDYHPTISNESFKSSIKFCLKFGISGQHNLLNLLCTIVRHINFSQNDLGDIMEMLTSHSEFMDLILEDNNPAKMELLSLMLEIFKRSEDLMDMNYVPLMLGAYRGTVCKSDRIILLLLKMFEANPKRTNFYDFKPFLWGKAAANHYSVKSDIQGSLWKQPRTGAILDILEMDIVLDTIKYYPLDLELRNDRLCFEVTPNQPVYDLSFLLPLFTTILSSENAVQTYRFTKTGALSLTILALASSDENIRGAACFVLSRFYSHVESRRSGKDNLLWIRFLEAICKGVGILEDFKLNNFAGIFLARMGLVLTNPNHIMYGPLSQYLTAKSVLRFKYIPELYTLLHSPDVNYKEHRTFILEVLLDGMRTKSDFKAALQSVSFKLMMENFNSCLSDKHTKLLILKVINRATKIKLGVKLLCDNYGLLSWLNNVTLSLKHAHGHELLSNILNIVSNIIQIRDDYIQVIEFLRYVIDHADLLKENNLLKLLKILNSFTDNKLFLTENALRNIINTLGNKECLYYINYKQCNVDVEIGDDVNYYLKCLTLRWISLQSL